MCKIKVHRHCDIGNDFIRSRSIGVLFNTYSLLITLSVFAGGFGDNKCVKKCKQLSCKTSARFTPQILRGAPRPQPGTLLRLMSLISSEFQCSAVQCSVPCSPSVIWSLWEQKQYIINIVLSCYTEGCFRMSEEANDKVIHIHRQDFMEKLGIGDHLLW